MFDWNSSLQKTIEAILKTEETPILVVDKRIIKQKYQEFCSEFSNAKVYFALKANPHPGVVDLLQEIGCDFEISSYGELDLLLRLGIPVQRIISSNPVKNPAFIKAAHESGIEVFTFDSPTEVDKLSSLAPGSKVYARLSVPNEGSEWPLSKKFGVEVEEAAELLVQARNKGLEPYGITFHVGSQNTQAPAWETAIERSRAVWELVAKEGIELQRLNIGGGFPIQYTKPVPSIAEVAGEIKTYLARAFPQGIGLELAPGRALLGESGILVTSVIGKANRSGEKWLYTDVGVFNGLMETVGGIKYPMLTAKETAKSKWVLAGPTCDSFDVVSTEAELPELEVGDRIYILSAGTYTTAYASEFDGFKIPGVYYIE
ncbi:type III PLP-dependent enzyme [Chloroflexota bacterium]